MDSLARSFNATGLSSRAMNIFHKAKETINFRWGRTAKLVAGACLAVALRESNRPDCLRDISFLLDEPFPALSRAFISVTSATNIVLSRVETASYIPILHQQMSSLQALPPSLKQELSSISFLQLLRLRPPSATFWPESELCQPSRDPHPLSLVQYSLSH